MKWIYGVLGLLFGVSLCAQGPHNLNYNPRGNLKEAGSVSFGLDYINYYLNEEMESQGEYDFSYAFSNFLTYGLSGDGTGVAHHVYAVLFDDSSHNGDIHHYVTGGLQNIGGSSLVNQELLWSDLFFEYTADMVGHNTEYHIGTMRDMNDTTIWYPFFGTLHKFDFVDIGLEVNGRAAGFVLNYRPVPEVTYVLQFSQSLLEEDDADYGSVPEQLFTVGLRLNANVLASFKETMVSKKDMKEELDYVHARLDILEAKEKALSDMSSLDMLDSLEQALINRNVIDTEFDIQTKNLVKGALSHMQRGLEFYYQEKYKSALEEYKIVISLLPNSYIGHLRIGSIYYQLDDRDSAKKHWEIALKLNPGNQALRSYIEGLITPTSSVETPEPKEAILIEEPQSVPSSSEDMLIDDRDKELLRMNYREFEQELLQLKDYNNEN